jgi:hypothetical protein
MHRLEKVMAELGARRPFKVSSHREVCVSDESIVEEHAYRKDGKPFIIRVVWSSNSHTKVDDFSVGDAGRPITEEEYKKYRRVAKALNSLAVLQKPANDNRSRAAL